MWILPLALLAFDPATTAVEGPRPRGEIEEALAGHAATLDACTTPGLVTFSLIAAGVADAVTLLDGDDAARACVEPIARALVLRDRGVEPSTRVVIGVGPVPLPPVMIQGALDGIRATAARCVRDDGVAHDLRVTLTVSADGLVTAADVDGAALNTTRRVCLQRAYRRAVFPGGRDAEVRVVWRTRVERSARRPGTPAPTLFSCLGITW